MNKWEQELNRYLNEENISDLYDKNLIKEMLEFEPKKTWVEEEMERLDKYWKEELWTWEQECILRNYNKKVLIWEQSSSTRENYKPMQSELENKEEIIKKQIQVIRELNKDKESLVQGTIKLQDQINILSSENNEIKEEIESQDTGIKVLIQDWKELKEDCAKQTKEVLRLTDKVRLMEDMNNELQLENLRLKNRDKSLGDTPCIPFTPYVPYINPYTNPYPYNPPYDVFCSTVGSTTINNT